MILDQDRLKEGEKIILNGSVRYWQDFSYWEKFFNKQEFTIRTILDNGMIALICNGHGVKEQYGNGAIWMNKSDVVKHKKEHICNRIFRKLMLTTRK